VAVAGRIKSGESTLGNALIGRRVAPTDVGECTRLVTRVQYGTVDRVEVVFTNVRKQVLPFAADGMIPAELGVNIDEVSHIEAYVTNAVLQGMTVIDTPGLGSLDAASVSRTEKLLGSAKQRQGDEDEGFDDLDDTSRRAVAGAEAVLYVVTQGVRADDQQALAAFTTATASREAGPVIAIAVLNKADTIATESVAGSGGDVWKAATLLAEKQTRHAQTQGRRRAAGDRLDRRVRGVRRLHRSRRRAPRRLSIMDEEILETMLISADIFTSWECDVPSGTRLRLAAKLDLYGIGMGVARSGRSRRSPPARCAALCSTFRGSPPYDTG
jgi:hypothetical protein